MGKRRNTAKTGDKGLYKSRGKNVVDALSSSAKKRGDEDDPMYNRIDQFHNERDEDFLRLGDEDRENDDDDHDLVGNKESVLDLGAGGENSSEEEDDDSDDGSESSDDEHGVKKVGRGVEPVESDDDESSSSDSESEDEDLKEMMAADDPRNWGKKKALYYNGDTADLEIGQEEEDALLEEDAAKEVQASRFQEMEEDDFVLSEDENEQMQSSDKQKPAKAGATLEKLQSTRDTSMLTRKEARKLLQKQHPELLPMVSYFSDVVKDLKDRTQVATDALFQGESNAESVGATLQGQQYLLTKSMIQKTMALNSVVYLLLKSASVGDENSTSNIQAHPIMDQLKNLYAALEKFEEKVHNKTNGIDEQLDNLVKAAALMGNSGDNFIGSDAESVDKLSGDSGDELEVPPRGEEMDEDDMQGGSDEESEEEDGARKKESEAQSEQTNFQRVLNEARFGLRPVEAKETAKFSRKRRMDHLEDFGDLDGEVGKSDTRALASTINTIEQRSQTTSRKRRPMPDAEELDELDDSDDRLAQGIKMMEEEMGKLDDEDDEDGSAEDERFADESITDPDLNDDSMEFYKTMAKKSKAQKSFKKSLYQVAPKFPRVDNEVEGERAISRTIMKNRGLVAHKAKINRNPRVKKREQYRKALIRRKGAVREVRQGEMGKYGGEGTGIKSAISRSRKLSQK